jgi:hypothetical protein
MLYKWIQKKMEYRFPQDKIVKINITYIGYA